MSGNFFVVAQFSDTVLYGKATRDWFKAYNTLTRVLLEPEGDLAKQIPPKNPVPPASLETYAGHFDNPYFDAAEVKAENDKLTLFIGPNRLKFPLKHWDGNVFAIAISGEIAPPGTLSSVRFNVVSGKANGFEIEFFDGNGLGHWKKPANPDYQP